MCLKGQHRPGNARCSVNGVTAVGPMTQVGGAQEHSVEGGPRALERSRAGDLARNWRRKNDKDRGEAGMNIRGSEGRAGEGPRRERPLSLFSGQVLTLPGSLVFSCVEIVYRPEQE